jgi:GTP-binding protein HflX
LTKPQTDESQRLGQPSFSLSREPEQAIAERTRTYVVGPYASAKALRASGATPSRDHQERIEEACGLAAAIDLTIIGQAIAPVDRPRPSTLLGKGKVEEIAGIVKAQEIGLVMVDAALSPVQQRNLEKAWGAKVIDRTGLILEIFGRRARTREGALQVELAHLSYQKSRLVRSWTHLERQRGGFGFLGGPGETQIEADRRLIQERITRLEREIENVMRTRGLHRAGRERVPYPTVAIVGYTNAGKSTLFNRLTRADVLAKDMLFATLDPTARAITLPHKLKVILSDTVGFISDLPTQLVAAFRATLEDVIEADLVLHVRDISREDSDAQAADVAAILTYLGIDPADDRRIIEVWNKADLLDADARARLLALRGRRAPEAQPLLVSAVTREGLETLEATIEERLSGGRPVAYVALSPAAGGEAHWLYENGEVLSRRNDEEGRLHLSVRVPEQRLDALFRRFPDARLVASPRSTARPDARR